MIMSLLRFLILKIFDWRQSIESRLDNWLKTDEERDWEKRFIEEYRKK
jgi:hypothetical protein